ncbi:MAG: HAMP domain-containing sensor histidine kinase [Lachnospiraceae bacterium]|nr:HAMP domain-containing sensor histidine kinase [Lachnospiraceae bacterium]
MKIGRKLFGTFVGVITVSMIVFLLFCYYCLNVGYFSGISHNDMKQALAQGEQFLLNGEDEMQSLKQLKNSYTGMDFAVITDGVWISSANVPVLVDESDILDAINGQLNSCKDYEVLACAITQDRQTEYLICFVDRQDFEAMSYKFNMVRARGMLGKLAIVGVVITVILLIPALYLMQRKYKEKELYEKRRKEMISNLSHDLRTPLSSVVGYSEMLQNGIYDNEEERNTYIDIIHRKAVYMEKLLSELLEYSRLELGTIRLQKQKVDITELVREILIEYYPEIEKNQYTLELAIPEHPIIGIWDREKLGRVIRNLIDNALKYGMDGKKLRIAVEEKGNHACIEIQDYGKGISQKEIPHVAEQFYRADCARNSKQGGMGLGLFIVQEIVRLHNGRFHIESKEQQGTRICVQFPL